MSPAFSSTKQAGGFVLLLFFLLLLPLVGGKSLLPPREHIYSSVPWETHGPYHYIQEQIFEEKGDIDIAFVGSSHMLYGIDTPYVQDQLSKKLGRKAVVRTIAWAWTGFDALYFIVQDLLQNRKVHMLVIYDEYNKSDVPHVMAPRWFRFGDNSEALADLPLRVKVPYYIAAVLGMPQNLLGLVRSNLPIDIGSSKFDEVERLLHTPDPATRYGSYSAEAGFSPKFVLPNPVPFIAYVPSGGAQESDTCVYSVATKSAFEFTGPALPEWQLHFARKFAALSQKCGSKVIMLHVPTFRERNALAVPEREYWPQALGCEITMVGIPPKRLSQGMTEADVQKLFYDDWHLNRNGQKYYTSLITPRLLQIYDFKY